MSLLGRRTASLVVCFGAFVLGAVLCSCTMPGNETDWWHPPPIESPHCTLILDVPPYRFWSWKLSIPIRIVVDGYTPEQWEADKQNGVYTLLLPVGEHTVRHSGEGESWLYRWDPIVIDFEGLEGKTYTITIRGEYSGSKLRGAAYSISYEGWPEEVSSQWPTQNVIQGGFF